MLQVLSTEDYSIAQFTFYICNALSIGILLLANTSRDDGIMTSNAVETGDITERTEALYGNDMIIKRVLETFSWLKVSVDGCLDHTEPRYPYNRTNMG
jgi:hypothetical protein